MKCDGDSFPASGAAGAAVGRWRGRRPGVRQGMGAPAAPSPGRPWSLLRCMFRAGRSSPILMTCSNNRSRISSTTIWFWRFSLAGVAMRPRRMGSMPPGTREVRLGEGSGSVSRAQTGVRVSPKCSWGIAEEGWVRAAPSAKVAPVGRSSPGSPGFKG